jgi:hypothetical protein
LQSLFSYHIVHWIPNLLVQQHRHLRYCSINRVPNNTSALSCITMTRNIFLVITLLSTFGCPSSVPPPVDTDTTSVEIQLPENQLLRFSSPAMLDNETLVLPFSSSVNISGHVASPCNSTHGILAQLEFQLSSTQWTTMGTSISTGSKKPCTDDVIHFNLSLKTPQEPSRKLKYRLLFKSLRSEGESQTIATISNLSLSAPQQN